MSLKAFLNTLTFIVNHPLNREHKVEAIIRFLKWQIGSRLVSGAVVFDWINGTKFLVRTAETGLTGNIYTGLHEFADMAFLLHFLRPDDLFIDVGANVGSYTLLACGVVGAKGYAFEPVPTTYHRLVENIRLNHLEQKVKCINKGVGAQQGVMAFTVDSDTTNHVILDDEQSGNTVDVEVTTLDNELREEFPTLLKIDVEGYETRVLEGAHEILERETLYAVIMEVNGSGQRYGFDESKILQLMFDYGFKSYSYDPFRRTLISLRGKNLESGNTLFLRDESYVLARLKSTSQISILGKSF